jgi:hypothetical protein
MPACNGPDRGCNITLPRKRADFPLVSAGVNRQPTGAGSDADMSAGARRSFAGATAATEITSVAGSVAVTPRLSSSPMRQPRPVKEVSWDGGAAPGRISQGRCPMLELLASKRCPSSS